MAAKRKRRNRKPAETLPVPFGTVVEEDPAAEFEALRGTLEGSRVPPDGRRHRPGSRDKAFQEIELVTIENASDFKSDRVLSDEELFIEELLRHPQMQELLEQMSFSSPNGRPRRKGHWFALYLYMVAGGANNPYDLMHSSARRPGLRVAEFDDWSPTDSVVADRFEELESKWELVRAATGLLVKTACEAVPEIPEIVIVDSTAGVSAARLVHCCTDIAACKRAGKIKADTRDAAWEKSFKQARLAEAELPEEKLPRNIRTRQVIVEVDDETKSGPRLYRLFFINGHWYLSPDLTSGFRRYDNDAQWHGAYHQFAVSPVVWMPLAGHSFPCDIQEWDGFPTLFETIEDFIGTWPYIVGADRGFSISDLYEFCLRRDMALVAPRRGITDTNPRIKLRKPEVDEHGLPRCGFCGGVGLLDLPGFGLERRGRDPKLAFVCAAPFFPECAERQTIDPDLAWPTIVPLSRLNELYHAVRYWRNPAEGVHRHIRWNYRVAANDAGSQIFRFGIPAQRLRMWSALLIMWWKLNLRHGWIHSRGLQVTINDSRLVRLNGTQDRASGRIVTPGHGSKRLATLRAERDQNNTDLPYGDALERLRARIRHELGIEIAA